MYGTMKKKRNCGGRRTDFRLEPSLKEPEDKPPEDKRKPQQERLEDRAKYAAMLRAIPKEVYENMPPMISIPDLRPRKSPSLSADKEKL